MPVGDIYVKVENRSIFNSFSKNYEKYLEEQKEEIVNLLGENIKIITLEDNYSFKSIIVFLLSYIFFNVNLAIFGLIFFFLVVFNKYLLKRLNNS